MRLIFFGSKKGLFMDEIEKRLRESTDACIKSFEEWVKASKNLESREQLMEAMHEVRKVISRVEIEIAISERDRLGSRPIPIPPHRSQRKRPGEGGEEADFNGNEDFNEGNDTQPMSNAGNGEQPRRQGGGGQRHGGRDRRPMHRQGGGGGNNNSDNQPQ